MRGPVPGPTLRGLYITLAENAPQDILMMAGIWEPTTDGGACCAIITEPASDRLAHIHDRKQLVLDAVCRWGWLDPELSERQSIREKTVRLNPDVLVYHPVSTRVNRPVEDDPELIEAIA